MVPTLVQQGREGVAEHFSKQAMAQMPQVSRPDTLDEVTVHELTEDRIDPVTDAAEVGTASGTGGLQLQALRCQCLSERGLPVVAVPHDDTLSAVDQLEHDGRLMDIGGGEAEAHDNPGPGDTKAVEGLAQQHVVAEGHLAPETSAAVGSRELTDGEGEAIHQLQPELAANPWEQPLPYALLEMAQIGRLSDEGGALALPEGGEEVGVVSPEGAEERLVLVQGQALADVDGQGCPP